MYIDSHTHLYLHNFDDDRVEVVKRALESGVKKLLLPNLDSSSIDRMLSMKSNYPGICYPMIGLHPGSVKDDFERELRIISRRLYEDKYYAIGEIGIDLYWDRTFEEEQKEAFKTQIGLAKEADLPLVIHSRESFREIFEILDKEMEKELTGVFHSFTGGKEELAKIKDYDFYFGINGIVSFKNSNLKEILNYIPEERLLLETDSPYLAPVPKRGKRNESSYLPYIAGAIADIMNKTPGEIADITRENAMRLFKLD